MTTSVFSERDIQEIESLKQRETDDIIKSINDCIEIELLLREATTANEFAKSLDIPKLRLSLTTTVKIMIAILKDREEGIH